MDKNIKRFISVDKIYSNYEAKNFKDVFGVKRKAKVGGLNPGKKNKKTNKVLSEDTIKKVLEVFDVFIAHFGYFCLEYFGILEYIVVPSRL